MARALAALRQSVWAALAPHTAARRRETYALPELTVISWRAIPAQVTAGKGRAAARIQLSDRFQEAIDAAAMRAGLIGTDSYLEEWRRSTSTCGDDLAAEVAATAAQLEHDYTDERLERLVRSNGEEENTA